MILHPECVRTGWEAPATPDAACLFQTCSSVEDDVGTGDITTSGALCDSNDDSGSGLDCIGEDTGTLDAI